MSNERTPLLKSGERDRIPWFPIILLAIWRAAYALYFGYIFTWITPFILENGLADQSNVGRIAGWIESAYSAGVLCGLAPAAVLSDAYGRKSIALIGIVVSSVATASFGFATTLTQMVLLRYFTGLFVAFIPVTVVVMMVEMSSAKTQPTIIAVNSAAWQFGSFVAPFFGGLLSTPARNWPHWFAGTIWEIYPYAMPGIAVVMIPLGAGVLALCFLKETLRPEDRQPLLTRLKWTRATVSQKTADDRSSMLTKPVVFILFLWFYFIFICLSSWVIEVLFLSTARKVGGLAFTPREIAILFGIRPLLNNAFTLMTYPALIRRFGCEKVARMGLSLAPIPFYLAYFVFGQVNSAKSLTPAVNLTILFILAVPLSFMNMGGTAVFQTMTSRAPTRAQLTQMNTASEYAANIGHGVGAVVGSNLWTFCVTHHLFNGQAAYLALVGLSVLLVAFVSRLTKEKGWADEAIDTDVVEEVRT